jgi:predicted  nucleic acid-binding Zn-ribbon protein
MASSLDELKIRHTALTKRLERLLNLKEMMANPDKQLDNDIRLTNMRIADVQKEIDAHPHR